MVCVNSIDIQNLRKGKFAIPVGGMGFAVMCSLVVMIFKVAKGHVWQPRKFAAYVYLPMKMDLFLRYRQVHGFVYSRKQKANRSHYEIQNNHVTKHKILKSSIICR